MARISIANVAVILTLSMTLLLAPCAANADMPALHEVFVDVEGFLEIAARFFEPRVVETARGHLSANSYFDGDLGHPYGPKFRSIGNLMTPGGPRFHETMRVFWGETCGKNDCDTLRRFLAEVEKRPRVRGMSRTRSFSGCSEVKFEVVEHSGIDMVLTARQFNDCRPVKRGRRVMSWFTGLNESAARQTTSDKDTGAARGDKTKTRGKKDDLNW